MKNTQWHKTFKIKNKREKYFLKKYKPNSFEIKNELNWLKSDLIKKCKTFSVPAIKDFSIKGGYIKMDLIYPRDKKSIKFLLNSLVTISSELHILKIFKEPLLRQKIKRNNFGQYIKLRAKKKIKILRHSGFKISNNIEKWLLGLIEQVEFKNFSVVHRDLRIRHLLFKKNTKLPILVDWEFSNISDPAQDLAKIIYDGIRYKFKKEKLMKIVIKSHQKNFYSISSIDIRRKILFFLAIIPLEDSCSLLQRRVSEYRKIILNNIKFLNNLYNEEKN